MAGEQTRGFVLSLQVSHQLFFERERTPAKRLRTIKFADARVNFHVMIVAFLPHEFLLANFTRIWLGIGGSFRIPLGP